MHYAYISSRRNNLLQIRIGLALTSILAIAFVWLQYASWDQLVAQDVYFVGNPAGSFIYVFTGLHVLHLVGGIGPIHLGDMLILADFGDFPYFDSNTLMCVTLIF